MSMEALPSRSELRKEQERERRRLRDRQRRQSMSLEEREKHLARRRRNYQLRRQRAQNAAGSSASPQIEFQQTDIATCSEIEDAGVLQSNQLQLDASVSDVSAHSNGLVHFGLDQQQENLVAERTKSECLEIPADKLATIPGKLRLNRVKHLARVINANSCNGITPDMNGNATPNCISVKGLRLNRIKRLARAMQPAGIESAGEEDNQNIREG